MNFQDSSNMLHHGFFSAKFKLPGNYTAGIVVKFYLNRDVFEKNHDELDIEFLGNIWGKKWGFQTNAYGNGSTSRSHEERYTIWFNPTLDFHRYTILWTATNIIFYVDDVLIREIIRIEEMGNDFPAKPTALYASSWATSGSKYKVNYLFAPFVAEFKDYYNNGLELESRDFATLTYESHLEMRRFRQRNMYYSYCYDSGRYPVALPECVMVCSRRRSGWFKDTGRLKFGGSHRRRSRRRGRGPIRIDSSGSDKQQPYEGL